MTNIAGVLHDLTKYTQPNFGDRPTPYEVELHTRLSQYGENGIKNFATQIYAINCEREEFGLPKLNTRDVIELSKAYDKAIPLAYYAKLPSFREMNETTKKINIDMGIKYAVAQADKSLATTFARTLQACRSPEFHNCNAYGQETLKNSLLHFNIEQKSTQSINMDAR